MAVACLRVAAYCKYLAYMLPARSVVSERKPHAQIELPVQTQNKAAKSQTEACPGFGRPVIAAIRWYQS